MIAVALLLILPALALASPAEPLQPRDCQSNNCIRAIRGNAFPSRQGTLDCESFLRATVTPATFTATQTLSYSVTFLVTSGITATQVVPVTATSTVISTALVTTTVSPAGPGGVGKRQQTVIPSAIPSYASACTNFQTYSSACSCLGVTASTVTVAAPLSTKTTSTTVTPTTSTVLTTVATTTFTSVAFTESTTATVTVTATTTQAASPTGFRCGPALNTCCENVTPDLSSGSSYFHYNGVVDPPCMAGYTALCCMALLTNGPNGEYEGSICDRPTYEY